MFWIHGGGFDYGSIFVPEFNGTALASNDVVVVTVNYRLNIMGFLFGDRVDAPGNVGLYDQLLALKWVRDNIYKFGGDKDQITIFGESAGSWSVSAHILSPLSKGLFKRAIMQSCAHMYNKDRDPVNKTEGLNFATKLAKNFNCSINDDWLQCLQKVNATELVNKMFAIRDITVTYPVVGTEFLPLTARQAFEHNLFNSDIDLMAGINKYEGQYNFDEMGIHITYETFANNIKLFDREVHNLNTTEITEFYLKSVNKSSRPEVRHAFGEFMGDLLIKCPTFQFAKQVAKPLSNTSRNVYFYELSYVSQYFADLLKCDTKSKYVCHAMDLTFVFGLPLLTPEIYLPKDIFFANNIMKMWTNFAKTGTIDNNWPKLWNDSTPNVWHIHDLNSNNETKTFDHLFDKTCDEFWKNYFI
ncbi:cholinesterase 2-like [Oppia nitens]|uniref:cholinesterase 2-like n=1 Tax=Oppia nitens TaxID=1686743 RepID=UPI0023DAA7AB|nr:cholinesterase 2-like [Oppia nitens]